MAQFLQGNKTTNVIAWRDKNELNPDDLSNALLPKFILKMTNPIAFIPVSVAAGLIFASFYSKKNIFSIVQFLRKVK